jgi:hypothetical protein
LSQLDVVVLYHLHHLVRSSVYFIFFLSFWMNDLRQLILLTTLQENNSPTTTDLKRMGKCELRVPLETSTDILKDFRERNRKARELAGSDEAFLDLNTKQIEQNAAPQKSNCLQDVLTGANACIVHKVLA